MKLEFEKSEDWRTDTGDPMINAFRELMSENIDHQDDPYVGIFWYDVESDDLFGVRSACVDDLQFYHSNLFNANVKTCTPLHNKVWDKESRRKKDRRFSGNYTRVPRGRVFEIEDVGFVVCVGEWINEYPQAKELILDEFQLPEDTEFKIDSHWNLGHGWSDKFI